jgi:hypothetical protein
MRIVKQLYLFNAMKHKSFLRFLEKNNFGVQAVKNIFQDQVSSQHHMIVNYHTGNHGGSTTAKEYLHQLDYATQTSSVSGSLAGLWT